MARGDILSIDLPPPPGGSGHEQAGTRPAIAVQTDSAANLPTLMVVPLTSNRAALRFDHTIEVMPSSTNGLSLPSVLLVFQLRAVDRRRIRNTIGRLEPNYLEQLEIEIKRLLDLE
jgi:mRNA interferase MazF